MRLHISSTVLPVSSACVMEAFSLVYKRLIIIAIAVHGTVKGEELMNLPVGNKYAETIIATIHRRLQALNSKTLLISLVHPLNMTSIISSNAWLVDEWVKYHKPLTSLRQCIILILMQKYEVAKNDVTTTNTSKS